MLHLLQCHIKLHVYETRNKNVIKLPKVLFITFRTHVLYGLYKMPTHVTSYTYSFLSANMFIHMYYKHLRHSMIYFS